MRRKHSETSSHAYIFIFGFANETSFSILLKRQLCAGEWETTGEKRQVRGEEIQIKKVNYDMNCV